MSTYELKFNSPQSVAEFVSILNKYGVVGDLISGRIHVDARSILGILSLNLNNPVELQIIDIRKQVGTDIGRELHKFTTN